MKETELGHVDASLLVKPNLPVLGPKLGKALGDVRAALAAGEFDDLGDGRFRAAGHELAAGRGARRALGPRRLGDRLGRRRHGCALDDARRRATARGPGLRADPPRQLAAQGVGPRAHRSHRADDPGERRRPARARRVDQGRDARDVARGDGDTLPSTHPRGVAKPDPGRCLAFGSVARSASASSRRSSTGRRNVTSSSTMR